jgi:hypothetical protein
VTFTLVSGADVVFPDPATDPYDNSDNLAQLDINQMQLDMIVGNANYDIGHLFGTGGGGVAFAPSVCSEIKAKGYSARVPPTGDSFWVDYVAHEIGHQFSASHTYNTLENGTCSTRSAGNAYEVASGATIMSYVGICSQRNLQQFAIDGFHVRSLTQIIAELANTNGGGATCGTPAANGNTPPTVATAAGFTIPKQTPFLLTATGSDPDPGTALTYSWEQYDLAPSATGPNGTPPGAYDNDADGVLRPLFRVYAPVTSPSRSYPSLPYILANANVPPQTFTGTSPTGAVCAPGETCVTGEVLPTVTRTMNFRVVLRDNNGGVTDAATQVNVDGASGPFVVTAPNSAVSVVGNSQINVTWDVANTSQAPINAANVKISLSTDGGQSFNTVLAPSTPNDGSEAIALPNISVTTARIKVEAVDNIFFDISDTNFTITEADPTPPATYAPLSPARVWDSRFGPGPTGLIGSGQSRDVTVTGVGGVPATGVTAVVLNVTAVNPTATTFATIWPTGEVRPLAANLNIPPGDVRPNLVIVKVGAGGQISVFNNAGNVHFVADVAGWYGATGGERYTAVSPSRVWDSRFGPGPVGQLAGGQSTNVLVTGVGGVPATGVTAVVLNVAAVRPTSQTFITGWPAGEVRPLAANLNVPPNDVRPNLVILKVGAGGQVSFFNNAGNVDLVADVAGYFSSSGSSLNSVSPSRVWDSRFGPGPTGKIGAGQSRSVTVTGVNGIPATGVTAVVLNVAAVRPTATTFVTAWPSGETRPLAANLNVPPNDVRANLVIVKVGANGQVDFFNNSGELDLVADIAGWFGAPGQ